METSDLNSWFSWAAGRKPGSSPQESPGALSGFTVSANHILLPGEGPVRGHRKVQLYQEVPMNHQDPRVTEALNKYCSTPTAGLIQAKALALLRPMAVPGAGPEALPPPK